MYKRSFIREASYDSIPRGVRVSQLSGNLSPCNKYEAERRRSRLGSRALHKGMRQRVCGARSSPVTANPILAGMGAPIKIYVPRRRLGLGQAARERGMDECSGRETGRRYRTEVCWLYVIVGLRSVVSARSQGLSP